MIPKDTDLVVGIPRSGLLVANLVSLALNLPLADLDGFLEGRILAAGKTRRRDMFDRSPADFRRVLVIDDSILNGHAMQAAKEKVARLGTPERFFFCAVYGPEQDVIDVDLIMERVPSPRIFQWNMMHHRVLQKACFDIDGVLCFDPTSDQNDDGEAYTQFIQTARPLLVPGQKIAHLVTSRLERYRSQTEAWLAANDIEYGKLWMLDLPNAAERRRQGAHGSFKAGVYRQLDETIIFVESEERQAIEIARRSGKPVLSIESHSIVYSDRHLEYGEQARRRLIRMRERLSSERSGWRRKLKRILKRS